MLSSILLSPANLKAELEWQSTAEKYGAAIVCHPPRQCHSGGDKSLFETEEHKTRDLLRPGHA